MLKKHKLEELKLIAYEKGGFCLSTEYVNNHTKMKWKCTNDHIWQAVPHHIKNGSWCPQCYGNKRKTIEEMHELAERMNGKCLSDKYKGINQKLKWECNVCGYSWHSIPKSVIKGHWCPNCAGRPAYSIEQMKKIAAEKSGSCISKKYINNHSKLVWECSKKHIFKMSPNAVKSGQWCPKCRRIQSANKRRATIEEMYQIALERNGKCLSTTYIKSNRKLLWECADGHQWEATPNSVKLGSWCPICSPFLNERKARAVLEALYGFEFRSTRDITWLTSPDGFNLELDGYNDLNKIAFEYQGVHHFENDSYFEKSKYDELKRKLCREHNVKLVEISGLERIKNEKEIIRHVYKQVLEQHIPSPAKISDIKVNFKIVYSPNYLEDLKNYAFKKKGRLLSESYLGATVNLIWQCSHGHTWESPPSSIKNGRWCPFCAGKRFTINDARFLASKKNGKCLSTLYKNSREKLKWECDKGHVWYASVNSVKNGSWCPLCGYVTLRNKFQKYSIKDMVNLAKKFGGVCLSDDYINNNTKLEWKCSRGHIFEKSPILIIRKKQWCPKCSGQLKTIDDMRILASQKGGKCLSTEYKGVSVELVWECQYEHTWKAKPQGLIYGNTWCPVCARVRINRSNCKPIEVSGKKFGSFKDACKYYNLNEKLVNMRIRRGWSIEKAFNEKESEQNRV
jgi:hypothetical protein